MFNDKLKLIGDSLREHGAELFPHSWLLRVKLFCLRRVFGFSNSHIASALMDERYRAEAVALVSNLHPQTVVEFGSGLGNMIARVDARKRIGFDVDRGAIGGARFLNGDTAQYFCASFLDSEIVVRTLLGIDVQSIDVLVLTNWIHKVPTEHILRGLAAIHGRIPIRYLLLETIRPEFTGCAHQLATADLARFGDLIGGIEVDEIRSLHIVSLASFESNQLFRLRQAVASATGQTSSQL